MIWTVLIIIPKNFCIKQNPQNVWLDNKNTEAATRLACPSAVSIELGWMATEVTPYIKSPKL